MKERLEQIRKEFEETIKKITDSPNIYDLYVGVGGNEEKGYYFSMNAIRRKDC